MKKFIAFLILVSGPAFADNHDFTLVLRLGHCDTAHLCSLTDVDRYAVRADCMTHRASILREFRADRRLQELTAQWSGSWSLYCEDRPLGADRSY